MRSVPLSGLIGACLLTLSFSALANDLDVPIIEQGGDGHVATCASSTVVGLDPKGDGFLAVRSGPGSQYRKLAELHNGDVVYEFDHKGPWRGVVYGETQGDECASMKTRPVTNPKKGWVHSKWLQDLAG